MLPKPKPADADGVKASTRTATSTTMRSLMFSMSSFCWLSSADGTTPVHNYLLKGVWTAGSKGV